VIGRVFNERRLVDHGAYLIRLSLIPSDIISPTPGGIISTGPNEIGYVTHLIHMGTIETVEYYD